MTTIKKHTDAMQARLGQVAQREQVLIKALSEALSQADQRLLDDVRSVTIEHESRRVHILTELHALAARIGAFPATDEQIEMLEDDALDLPYYGPEEAPIDVSPLPRGADWRKAAKNIANEFDATINGAQHSPSQSPPHSPRVTRTG